MMNIPDREAGRLRTQTLSEVLTTLDNGLENRKILINATSVLQNILAELERVDTHYRHLREENGIYAEKYDKHVPMLKHVISTLRLRVLLLDLTAIVRDN